MFSNLSRSYEFDYSNGFMQMETFVCYSSVLIYILDLGDWTIGEWIRFYVDFSESNIQELGTVCGGWKTKFIYFFFSSVHILYM